MDNKIPFNKPFVAGREGEYLQQVVANRSFAGNGPFTKRAAKLLEDRYGVPHVLLTHSCTGAMEVAALALDLGPGDEVIVPSYTFVSTASAFMRTGAKIVFCEIDPATMNLDVDDVARRITPNTRAIVPVHYGGVAADMDRIMDLAGQHDLAVVEDAAQGIEAKLDDRYLGTIAPFGAFSFHETKNIQCGLGGALLVNDPALFERAEDIWERGTNRTKMYRGLVDKYSWVELGSSFYPSELQAAFLLAQLEAIEQIQARRKATWERYQSQLAPLVERAALSVPQYDARRTINYHCCVIVLPTVEQSDDLRNYLTSRHIGAVIHYVPLHSSPMGRRLGYHADDLPITEQFAGRVLRLPMFNDLTAEQVDRTCDEVHRFLA